MQEYMNDKNTGWYIILGIMLIAFIVSMFLNNFFIKDSKGEIRTIESTDTVHYTVPDAYAPEENSGVIAECVKALLFYRNKSNGTYIQVYDGSFAITCDKQYK